MALVRTDFSKECIASIITVKRTNELETLAVTMMETIRSSETSVLIRATRRHIPEDDILRLHESLHLPKS
jgi:hypothetical protein